jgi:glycosyltransferase involved in cell wall biosynthesis
VRIGFDASILGPRSIYSGTGQYAMQLFAHLPALNASHEYLAYAPEGQPRPAALPQEIQWRPLRRRPHWKLSMLSTYLCSLPRLLADDRVDLFHVPTVHPRPSLPPVPRGLDCPMVVTLHDVIPLTYYAKTAAKMPWRHRAYYRWNLRALRRAATVITVSDSSREEIIRELDVTGEKVVRVHNGVTRAAVSSKWPPPVDGPYVLCNGSFEQRKNLLLVMGAFASARASGLTAGLVVVADEDSGDYESVYARARQLGISESVVFLHRIPEEQIAALNRGAMLALAPSLAEGFGLPPLEAMVQGVPVIASDIAAHREILGDAAVLVPAADEQAWSDAIWSLWRDRARRDALAAAGHVRAARYDWLLCARETLAVFEAASRDPTRASFPSAHGATLGRL